MTRYHLRYFLLFVGVLLMMGCGRIITQARDQAEDMYSERKLMGALLANGVLRKDEQLEETGINPANFCSLAPLYMKEIGFGGYFFRKGGKILCQRTNIYKYSCDLIRRERQYA